MIVPVMLSVGAALVVGAASAVVTSIVAKRSLRWASVLGPTSVVLAIGAGLVVGVQQMVVKSQLPLIVLAATAPIAVLVGVFLARNSQRQAAEASAALEQERARRALEQSRRELIAWLSHDIRTPLAGIRAMGEALEDSVAPDPKSYYRAIVASAERTSHMVDDLMALAALHSGELPVAPEPVALGDIVSDLIAQLAPLAERRNVRLVGQSTGRTEVLADPRLLTRAAQNALVNAVNYTAPGSTVEARVSAEPDHVVLEIRDRCGGIPPADLSRLFDPGWRGDQARTPEATAGSGLGLPIVRTIAVAHGGSATVRNVGDGCCLRLTLPRE
ncbi:sensor histidine kinase KdpD [Tessaracoccus sp. OH4464_COT-324]|uniref:sensor histidine kinase n=1 Tax=Tessaracoccus sp. OH4464_COT-324 TaxID=2491059 RepID=UPI000F630EBF|nr:HAMP domain-containing sensor histidine kinase [Tessaracoccus sp. OH4464_COT-324]RRD46416.1 sensor histidine kinase [Tessaracoccus sp. OH4464_COT-324]